MSTFKDLCTTALMELGVVAGGDTPSGEDIQIAKTRLGQVADQWNARSMMAFNRSFTNYVLTPNHQPHTIGVASSAPAPDFNVPSGVGGGSGASVRPQRIYGAAIIFNNVNPNVTKPIPIRDDDWWANKRVKSLAASVPTDLYYSPDFPNGSMYLWPIPSSAWGLEIELRTSLAQVGLDDIISMPQGYELALTLSVAEELISIFPANGRDDRMLITRAARARGILQAPNSKAPRMSTKDSGLGSGKSGDFNYYDGSTF